MDFYELEAFVVLARNLHFAKAAAALHASPSALSRLLGRLEEELGVRLLDRDNRQVELTEQGKIFLQFAEESLHKKDELHLTLGSDDGQLRGTLRVYASVTACYSILPPLAEALGGAHPELRLTVTTGDPADAEPSLREGSVDLALAALPPGGFTGLECYSVRRTPLVFVSSLKGNYAGLDLTQDSETLNKDFDKRLKKALAEQPLIVPQRGLSRERFDRWIKKQGVRPRIAAEAAGNEAVLGLARLGLGLGLVPRIVLENSPFAEGLILYAAGPDFGDYDIGFVMPATTVSSPKNAPLRSSLRTLLESVYPAGAWV